MSTVDRRQTTAALFGLQALFHLVADKKAALNIFITTKGPELTKKILATAQCRKENKLCGGAVSVVLLLQKLDIFIKHKEIKDFPPRRKVAEYLLKLGDS